MPLTGRRSSFSVKFIYDLARCQDSHTASSSLRVRASVSHSIEYLSSLPAPSQTHNIMKMLKPTLLMGLLAAPLTLAAQLTKVTYPNNATSKAEM